MISTFGCQNGLVLAGARADLILVMEAGRIVEDWSALDSLELLRQLGLVRTLLAAPRLLRATRA